MLYDELVPKGEYLAHYGVPKDQWSPEARARHNRNHPNKTVDPGSVWRTIRTIRNLYDEYQENNYNRGGNRSTFGSKVDEQRFQLAEARRRNRSQHNTGDEGNKPNSGQHAPNYRKPNKTETKSSLPKKPHSMPETNGGIQSRIVERAFEIASDRYHNGKNSSRSYKPTPNSQSADRAIATAISSYNMKGNGAKSTPRVTKGNSSWDRAVKDKLKEQDRPNTTPVVSKTKKRFATSQELRPWPEQSTTSGKKPAQSTDNGWTKPKPTNKPKSKDINKKKKKQTNTK